MVAVSPAEYLLNERAAETRSELIGGEVVAMAGVRRPHAEVSDDISGQLYSAHRNGGCDYFTGDVRVGLPDGEYYYPDLVVACDPQFADDVFDTLVNPRVVFEILSPSTEAADRGRKWTGYQTIPSLSEYVLVDPNAPRMEIYRRTGTEWLYATIEGEGAVLRLTSLGLDLPFREAYRRRIVRAWAE